MEGIKDCKIGKVNYMSQLEDGISKRITNDFLTRIVEEFAKQTSRYMDAIEDIPFVYRERQLNSILAPALSRITDIFLMELPLKREWTSVSREDYNDSHGWVDYWCMYRDITYFIELKHDFINRNSGIIRKQTLEKWETALEQLEVIKNEAEQYKKYSNEVFRIALEIIPIYEDVTNSVPKAICDEKNIIDIQETCMRDLGGNWSAALLLNKEYVMPINFGERKESYPGIIFMVKVLCS